MKKISVAVSFFILFAPSALAQKFKDVTKDAGIQHQFVVYEGMFGGGACVFDFNNDGFEDVYLTSGMNEDVLYQNNGNGTFKNVFKGSGLESAARYVTQGVASADVNKDGWMDLFVTTITSKDSIKKIPRAENLFFLNNGNGTFRNVTKEFKIDRLMSFSTGVCFGDIDGDGYSDLYVGNYFRSYEGTLAAINDATIVNASQTTEGYLLKNRGGKYFDNVYADYRLSHKGFGFGGVFTDYDNDHDLDLFVHHDFGYKATPDFLLRNEFHRDRFTDVSKETNMDLKINSMGTAIGDYDNDGLMDYYITNIRFNRFMVNQGDGKAFVDKSKEVGLGYVSISWGANFADFDHDTDLDLFVANGDLNPNDNPISDYYFVNDNGHFKEIAWKNGLNDYGIGRGSVVFDMDNDGDLDLLVVNQKPILPFPVVSETKLYRTDSVKGNWLKVKLKGNESDLNGIGARVKVVIGKTRMIREVDGGSSHLSQNSTIVHFGLGQAIAVDSIIVVWVGGKQQILTQQKINSLISVVETLDGKRSNKWVYMISLFVALSVVVLLFVFRKRV